MTTIEVPPVEGFWGPATPNGLSLSNWNQRKSWLAKNLSESQQQLAAWRLAACAFARRVLHIFEDKHPGDKRPRAAIETAERFAMGMATKTDLETAADAVYAAYAAAAYATYAAAVYAAYAAAAYATYAAAVYAAYAAAAYATYAAADAAAAADVGDVASSERLMQARLLTLFLPCDSVISESSKGIANRWIDSYLNHGIDEKGVREILADSLFDDGVPEERCQWMRHVEKWYLGMWPMTAENFVKGDS